MVLRAKERVETERDRALALKRDATLALEQQRTRALQSDNALRFARNEIARLTKKSNEATIVNASLRKESAGHREKLKKAEKWLAEAEHKEEELRREVAILRKDLQVQRQALKAKHAETARLENVLRDTLNGKLTEQAGDNGNVKRIEELEEKLTRLKVSIYHAVIHPCGGQMSESWSLLYENLRKEELKSRARADVAERVAAELRVQLDAKAAEVVNLRRHLDALDHVTLPTVPIPPESKTPLEPVEQSLFERRSNVKSGYTMATPTSVHSGHPEDRIRELEVALDEQLTRCDTAEKLAAKATGEVCGLREALQLTTERIASVAAQVAESKGLTGAYGQQERFTAFYATPTLNQGALPFSARSSRSATSASAQLEISRELQEVKRQTMFERLAREEAEESIRRWSQLQE